MKMNILRNIKIHEFLQPSLLITRCSVLKPIKNIHISSSFYAVDKLLLSKLRKKTGFSISHCKNALDLNENDLDKSEAWLMKEAQAHGWAKATKLASRVTSQGLIGVHIEQNVGGLIEVNCETDFVARNQDFKELVNYVAKVFTLSSSPTGTLTQLTKEFVAREALEKIQTAEGKSLSDLVALTIGKVGENIILSRGVKFFAPPDLDLVGYAHPSSNESVGIAGKYAALVAVKNARDEELKRELCAHVVGMNPSEIGTIEESEPNEELSSSSSSSEEPSSSSTSSSSSSGEESDDEESEDSKVEKKDETMLLRQKFIGDQDMTVGQVLLENDMEIVDFIRLECGEIQREV